MLVHQMLLISKGIFFLIAKECMTPIVNWQVGCWEATQTCAKKGDNEFGVANSEGTLRKHLVVPIGPSSEPEPSLLSRCSHVFLGAAPSSEAQEPLGAIPGTQNSGAAGPGERGGSYAHTRSLTHHTWSQSTDGHRRSAPTQKRAPTNIHLPSTYITTTTQAHATSRTSPTRALKPHTGALHTS